MLLCYNITKKVRVLVENGDGQMKEKIQKKFTDMSKLSKYILKYGLLLCLIFLIVSNILLYTSTDTNTLFIGKELASASFAAIAEICIGALIFDYCKDIN